MRQALQSVRDTLPRVLDPRAWAKYHPVAGGTLLLGGIAALAAAIARRAGPAHSPLGRSVNVCQARDTRKRWWHWVTAGCRTLLGAAGRALIGLALTERVHSGPNAHPTTAAHASRAEYEADPPATARQARRS
jgi:hypothetical protein